jgi:hypothetical protein
MGNEAVCTLRSEGKTFFGKALLETSGIVFRGETRLKIPFSSIKSALAKDGDLHIRTADALSVFELGHKQKNGATKSATRNR